MTTTVTLTIEELQGLMEAIYKSDYETFLSEKGKWQSPEAHGFATGKFKLNETLRILNDVKRTINNI